MKKFELDFDSLREVVVPDTNRIPLKGNEDRIIRVAFDMVRFKDGGPEELWQIQSNDDGEFLVRTFDINDEDNVVTSSWKVMLDNKEENITIAYNNFPIKRIACKDYSADNTKDVWLLKNTIYEKLNKDARFVRNLVRSLPADKQDVLKEVVAMGDYTAEEIKTILEQSGASVEYRPTTNEFSYLATFPNGYKLSVIPYGGGYGDIRVHEEPVAGANWDVVECVIMDEEDEYVNPKLLGLSHDSSGIFTIEVAKLADVAKKLSILEKGNLPSAEKSNEWWENVADDQQWRMAFLTMKKAEGMPSSVELGESELGVEETTLDADDEEATPVTLPATDQWKMASTKKVSEDLKWVYKNLQSPWKEKLATEIRSLASSGKLRMAMSGLLNKYRQHLGTSVEGGPATIIYPTDRNIWTEKDLPKANDQWKLAFDELENKCPKCGKMKDDCDCLCEQCGLPKGLCDCRCDKCGMPQAKCRCGQEADDNKELLEEAYHVLEHDVEPGSEEAIDLSALIYDMESQEGSPAMLRDMIEKIKEKGQEMPEEEEDQFVDEPVPLSFRDIESVMEPEEEVMGEEEPEAEGMERVDEILDEIRDIKARRRSGEVSDEEKSRLWYRLDDLKNELRDLTESEFGVGGRPTQLYHQKGFSKSEFLPSAEEYFEDIPEEDEE